MTGTKAKDLFEKALRQLAADRFDQAETTIKSAIQNKLIGPKDRALLARAYFELGQIQLERVKRKRQPTELIALLELACMYFEQSISSEPPSEDVLTSLANALRQLKRMPEALQRYREALERNPRHAAAYIGLGILLQTQNLAAQALECFDLAVHCKPDSATAHANRASVLRELGRISEAIQSFDHAISLNPKLPELQFNRGNLLRSQHRFMEAKAAYREAIRLRDDFLDARVALAACCRETSEPNQALVELDRVLKRHPDRAEWHRDRAVVLQDLKRLSEALVAYDQALALRPDDVETMRSKALCLLAMGKWEDGFQAYEVRLKIGSYARPTRLQHLPEWFANSDRLHQGSNQSRVLVYTEQGLGDAIQFSRWVLALLPQVEKVYFEVQAPLVDLMRCLANPGQPHRADALSVIVRGEIPADVSHCVSVMSLPARLSLADPLSAEVPKAPYLDLSCARQSGENRQIKAQLHDPQSLSSEALPGEFKVGFVWEGGFHSDETQMWSLNQRRNIELSQMHRLFEGLPICLYSFQKGERAEVLLRDYLSDGRWCAAHCVDLSERLTSFIETSYFLDQMDLLITVDTAIAHLAGAMAKPVWLLNRYDSCWRWGPSGCETLWYPSMRLIRQSKPGNWDLAIDQTRSMLEAWLNDLK